MALILKDARDAPDATTIYHAYCAMDCCGTRRVFDVIAPRLDPEQEIFYKAQMAFQNACLTMTLRGTKIDLAEKERAIKAMTKAEAEAVEALRKAPSVQEVWQEKENWQNERDGFCAKNSGKNHK